jgi:uroporphyrin-III C-methyltransferase
MSETSPPKQPVSKTPTPDTAGTKKPVEGQTQDRQSPKKHGSGGRVWPSLFALVVLAAIGAGGYFLWQTLQSMTRQLSADQETDRQQLEALQQRTEQLEQHIDTAVTTDIKDLQGRQQDLEDSMASLRSELTGDARVWDVEEVATLLQIANDRLHLEKEVAPSLAALQAADRHLQALKNPALLEVRRLLAEEIAALRGTAHPDIDGMAFSLNALIQGIDRLPIASAALPSTSSPPTAPRSGWRGVLHDLWEKLKSLVSIQHRGQADRPLLTPDERYFLRQNLRLTLEAARIALLRRDSQIYQQTLRSAQEWISRYFDNDAPATAGALQELAHLQQTDIAPSLPDISGSLNALQTWLNGQKAHQAPRTSGAAQP